MAARALYTVGIWVRESGQALDRLGSRLQGRYGYTEQLSRHQPVLNLPDRVPAIAPGVFVAPSASVIGDVSIGARSSVWYGATLRGDVNTITVGAATNIQDRAVVHVAQHGHAPPAPTVIGDRVTVGHAAVIHAATIEDEALIGIAAVLLDGVVVAKHAMVAAGALVTPGTKVGPRELWAGTPAKKVRMLTTAEIDTIVRSADVYADLADLHAAENAKSWEQIEAEKLRRILREGRSHDYSSHTGTLGKEEEVIETQAKLAEAER